MDGRRYAGGADGRLGARRLEYTETGPFPASQQFSDLPATLRSSSTAPSPIASISPTRSIAATMRSRGSLTTIDGREYVNFASYDYLGLNGHPDVVAAAKAAIDEHGTSVSASRIVAGERPLHRQLEAALADLYETETAVAFVSGHATNVSAIGTLHGFRRPHRHDELAHNSLLVGIKLSSAKAFAFRHNDLEAAGAPAAHAPARQPQRARRRRGPVLDGRRHRRPAEAGRAEGALRRLADGR